MEPSPTTASSGAHNNVALSDKLKGESHPSLGSPDIRGDREGTLTYAESGVDTGRVELEIRTLDSQVYKVPAFKTALIEDVKKDVFQATSIQPESQRLLFKGKEMNDSVALGDYVSTPWATLYLVVRFPGIAAQKRLNKADATTMETAPQLQGSEALSFHRLHDPVIQLQDGMMNLVPETERRRNAEQLRLAEGRNGEEVDAVDQREEEEEEGSSRLRESHPSPVRGVHEDNVGRSGGERQSMRRNPTRHSGSSRAQRENESDEQEPRIVIRGTITLPIPGEDVPRLVSNLMNAHRGGEIMGVIEAGGLMEAGNRPRRLQNLGRTTQVEQRGSRLASNNHIARTESVEGGSSRSQRASENEASPMLAYHGHSAQHLRMLENEERGSCFSPTEGCAENEELIPFDHNSSPSDSRAVSGMDYGASAIASVAISPLGQLEGDSVGADRTGASTNDLSPATYSGELNNDGRTPEAVSTVEQLQQATVSPYGVSARERNRMNTIQSESAEEIYCRDEVVTIPDGERCDDVDFEYAADRASSSAREAAEEDDSVTVGEVVRENFLEHEEDADETLSTLSFRHSLSIQPLRSKIRERSTRKRKHDESFAPEEKDTNMLHASINPRRGDRRRERVRSSGRWRRHARRGRGLVHGPSQYNVDRDRQESSLSSLDAVTRMLALAPPIVPRHINNEREQQQVDRCSSEDQRCSSSNQAREHFDLFGPREAQKVRERRGGDPDDRLLPLPAHNTSEPSAVDVEQDHEEMIEASRKFNGSRASACEEDDRAVSGTSGRRGVVRRRPLTSSANMMRRSSAHMPTSQAVVSEGGTYYSRAAQQVSSAALDDETVSAVQTLSADGMGEGSADCNGDSSVRTTRLRTRGVRRRGGERVRSNLTAPGSVPLASSLHRRAALGAGTTEEELGSPGGETRDSALNKHTERGERSRALGMHVASAHAEALEDGDVLADMPEMEPTGSSHLITRPVADASRQQSRDDVQLQSLPSVDRLSEMMMDGAQVTDEVRTSATPTVAREEGRLEATVSTEQEVRQASINALRPNLVPVTRPRRTTINPNCCTLM